MVGGDVLSTIAALRLKKGSPMGHSPDRRTARDSDPHEDVEDGCEALDAGDTELRFSVAAEKVGQRLDVFFSEQSGEFSP